jgi:predicted CoA-binding protein
MKNKTLVLGASESPSRYSNLAIKKLLSKKQDIVAIGKIPGNVDGVEIATKPVETDEIDTVTLYLNPLHQKPYYDYIISLKPRRIIFNPGTENFELEDLARKNGIQPLHACTLVMLGTGQY